MLVSKVLGAELDQAIAIHAQVIVDDIKDHAEAYRVGCIHKTAQRVRVTVVMIGCNRLTPS